MSEEPGMHSECMDAIAKRVKRIRAERKHELGRMGFDVNNGSPGEMRGYYEVLKLICPNPQED